MDEWVIVAVFAIIAWAYVRTRGSSSRDAVDELMGEGMSDGLCCFGSKRDAEKAKADLEELARLRERVEVLERIVTDKGYELNKEFDRL